MSGPAALSVDLIFGCRSRLRDPDLRYDFSERWRHGGPTRSVTPRDGSAARRNALSLSAMIALRLDGIVSYLTNRLRPAIRFGMHVVPIKGSVSWIRSKLISSGTPGECFVRVYNQSKARPLFITRARLP